MQKKYFESLTFNTSLVSILPVRKFQPREKQTIRKFLRDSLRPEGVTVSPSITLKITAVKDMYVGTLFFIRQGTKIPFLMTWGAKTQKAGEKLWDMIQKDFSFHPDVVKLKDCMPHAPFTADLILTDADPCALTFMLLGLSGSLSSMLSQAFLFPETL